MQLQQELRFVDTQRGKYFQGGMTEIDSLYDFNYFTDVEVETRENNIRVERRGEERKFLGAHKYSNRKFMEDG